MKKLLILGGSSYLVPIINTAKNMGIYTITCDYIPDNIAHNYSDEYHNISILDKEKVYDLANRLKVDGVMSFATDPGVITAAYVCEKLNLPSPPLKSVEILQNKDLFRKFLRENNFNVPYSESFNSYEEVKANSFKFKYPIIIKPVDSAGSKGVTKLIGPKGLKEAVLLALDYSFSKRIIIEDFIEKKGNSSDSDSFSINNELVFSSYSSQLFDKEAPNSFVPSAYIWPSNMEEENKKNLNGEISRLIKLLNMGTSIYNIETRVGNDGLEYIMELSPRGGGNRISEILKLSTNQDLISNNIKFALGMKLDEIQKPKYNGFWALYIIHSNTDGIFNDIHIEENFYNKHLKDLNLIVKKGQFINKFRGANDALGNIILKFDTYEDANYHIQNHEDWLKIDIQRRNNA
ncbi:MAG: ATP-grasp domain-containing protein [Lagierella massiliensis]|nr:ATP-grasp domain-containing protein [Lagierella massiliensis]